MDLRFSFLSRFLVLGLLAKAGGANLPAGFKETKLVGGINPTAVVAAPDGRIFLCEKNGRVRILKNGTLLARPFAAVDADFTEERGLLGIALDPGFPDQPWVYVHYTAKNPTHNRVSRFRASGDTAVGGENVLIQLSTMTGRGWHNGGGLHFGKDGKLLVATGNDITRSNSQDMSVTKGKILRINPDGSIPADNPFYNSSTGNNRAIWALGLRNPYTAAVHPVTGRFLINEVGDGTAEEINEGSSGANYGYPNVEGRASNPPSGLTGTYKDPVSSYPRSNGCAITGATFYQPPVNTFGAEYAGLFFFADYCSGWIKTMNPANNNAVRDFATGANRPIYLAVGPDGSLYYVNRGNRASGVTAGSPADNSTTQDGGLFRVTGPVTPTALSPRRPPLHLPALAGSRLALPAGKRSLALHDLSGRKVWEYQRSGQGAGGSETVWVSVPPRLAPAIHRVVFQ